MNKEIYFLIAFIDSEWKIVSEVYETYQEAFDAFNLHGGNKWNYKIAKTIYN